MTTGSQDSCPATARSRKVDGAPDAGWAKPAVSFSASTIADATSGTT